MRDTRDETRPRGRPRSETARTAILAATIALLIDQGLHAMNMDDVAERAGVSKATIYRWWASKEMLALDALATAWALPTSGKWADTGSLRGDLLAHLRPWVKQVKTKPYGRVIAALIAEAQVDPDFAKLYRENFILPRRAEARVLFVRAIERGEIAADVDFDVSLDLLYGPLYHRLLHLHAPLTDRFTQDVVDAVVKAIS
ncbi:MAG TPA: TetR/AcrR family transcriptional regulator [Acidothermaceae bacterium]|nr:TetR/AcrR family transcriptional regulator [Acidothermaceae bacterium]